MDKKLICSEFNKFVKERYGLDYPKTKILDKFENKLILKTYNYSSELSTESDSEFVSVITIPDQDIDQFTFKFIKLFFGFRIYEIAHKDDRQ